MTAAVRCAALLVSTVALALSGAQLSHAYCDTQSGVCEVTDEVVLQVDGTGGQGNNGSRRDPKYPPCAAIAKGVADDGREVPAGWVRVTCLEGNLPMPYWVPPSQGANPELIARSLLDRMQLKPISIGRTPLGRDPIALVGLPVWLWVDGPDRTSWGPATITAGGVSLTARVDSVSWDVGDGTRLSCGQGTVWRRGMGGVPSPTCGHTYLEQGTFTVRATSHWVARWSGYGRSGVIRLPISTSMQLRVGEIQAIRVNG